MKKFVNIEETQRAVEAIAARRLAVRRVMAENAIAAVAKDSLAIDAILQGKRPWWSALAPLTRGERETVYRLIVASATSGDSSVN